MRQIDIRIGFHNYTLACEQGQEPHVSQLGAEIDMRAKSIKEKMPRASENMILVMTALMLADELYEARQEAGMLHEKLAMGITQSMDADLPAFLPSSQQVAHHLAHAMNDIAGQIEAMAEAVERS